MSIQFEIEPDLRLIVARPSKGLTGDVLIEHLRALASDDTMGTGFGEILDLTGDVSCAATVPELYEIAEALKQCRAPLRRLALVSDDREMLPRLVLLQEFAKTDRLEIGVFQDATSAAAWLDVRAEQIRCAVMTQRN